MHTTTAARRRRRWPKGTWMRLKSPELLRAFVGDPLKDPSKTISGRRLAERVINPETGRPIHPSFIDHLLTGRRSSCTPQIAERIAEALGVPVVVLFDAHVPSSTKTNANRKTTGVAA